MGRDLGLTLGWGTAEEAFPGLIEAWRALAPDAWKGFAICLLASILPEAS